MVKEVKWTKYLWLSLLSFGAFMLEYLSIFVIEVMLVLPLTSGTGTGRRRGA